MFIANKLHFLSRSLSSSSRLGGSNNATVGGNETRVNEYPSMAGLVDSTERRIVCGATISEFYTLFQEGRLNTLWNSLFSPQFPRLTHWLQPIACSEDACRSSQFWRVNMTRAPAPSPPTRNFYASRPSSFTRSLTMLAACTISLSYSLVNRLCSAEEFRRLACLSVIVMRISSADPWRRWDGKLVSLDVKILINRIFFSTTKI